MLKILSIVLTDYDDSITLFVSFIEEILKLNI